MKMKAMAGWLGVVAICWAGGEAEAGECWAGSDAGGERGGAWHGPVAWSAATGSAAITSNTFSLASNKATEATQARVTFDAVVTVSEPVSPAALDTRSNLIAALAPVESNGSLAWFGLARGAWLPLSGPPPRLNAPLTLRTEFECRLGLRRLRYRLSTNRGASFSTLRANNAEWLDLPAAPSSLELRHAALSCLTATCASATSPSYPSAALVPLPLPTTNATLATLTLPTNWLFTATGHDLSSDPSAVRSALLEAGANGLPRYQSYLLGLDPANASDTPRLAAAALTNANVLALSYANAANAHPAAGMSLAFCVETEDVGAAAGEETTSAYTNIDATITAPLPSCGVRTYRLKIAMEPEE